MKLDDNGKPIITQEELGALIRKFGDRINQWIEANGSLRGLPVFQDEKSGEWIWIARSARRKLRRKNRSKIR